MSYKKFTDLDPVVLHKEDLLELEQMLHEDNICKDCEYTVTAKVSGQDLPDRDFHDLSELLQSGFPNHVDQLEVSIHKMKPQGTVEKSIRINLARDICSICISSDVDQQWVVNTNNRINTFFNKHKPWYTGVKKMLAPMFNASMVLSLLLALPAMLSGSLWLAVFPAAFVAYSLAMMVLGQKQLYFPNTRIALYPAAEEKRKDYEFLWTLGWGVTAMLAILSGSLIIEFS